MFEPAARVNEIESAGPAAEFLAVVGKNDDRVVAFVFAHAAQKIEGFARVVPRNHLAQGLIDRKNRQFRRAVGRFFAIRVLDSGVLRRVLFLRERGILPRRDLKNIEGIGDTHVGRLENRAVHKSIFKPGLQNRDGELRFPNALGQPHSARLVPKNLLNTSGKFAQLRDLVVVRPDRQNRFVMAAAQNFDLVSLRQNANLRDRFGLVFQKPVEERPGKVQRYFDLGMSFQHAQKRRVRIAPRIFKRPRKLSDRLMIVQNERKKHVLKTCCRAKNPTSSTRLGL